jgi:phenylpyruvate tautomerase PptA (4-oxalocrotonate tautomerase family)
MPILDVEIIASAPDPGLPADLAQSLADEAANVFGGPPGTVWVKLRIVPSVYYAEDHGKPREVSPIFVTVLKAQAPQGRALEDEIAQLTRVIATVLDRPLENVHILYQPDAVGRIAFGGKVVG